jgi:archaellum component FlaG (FlaF/FlaG flagellin family)
MKSMFSKLMLVPMLVLVSQWVTSGPAAARKPWEGGRRKAYKVYLYSQPERAAVYVNDKKWGVFCYTPCKRVKLPYKRTYTLIFVKDGYEDKKEELKVTRRYWRRHTVRTVLKRQIQPAIIDVQSDASGNATGAQIYVDGKQVGTVPMKVKVKPGRHQVEIKKAGYSTHKQWVTLTEKQVWTVQAIMKPLEKPKGTLLVAADVSDAEVLVDGKAVGTAPVVVKDLAEGPHTVEVRKKGAPPWKQVVVVKSGSIKKVTASIGASVPKHGTLRVVCNVPGATVYVDGEKKGKAPLTVPQLLPGDHIVRVEAEGYMAKQVPFKVVVDQQSLVTVDLEKKKEEAPTGTIRIQSDQPDAEIILDGRRIGKAPKELKDIPAGLHLVKVVKPGFLTYSEKVKLQKGQTYTITALLKKGGKVKITSSPAGATVFIDTKPVGRTPVTGHVLEEGTYTVEVELNGYEREQKTISVEGGKPVSLHLDLVKIRTGPTPSERVRGLTSFGALAVPPGRFTSDVTAGFLPYYGRLRLTVGAYSGKYFGVDAGVLISLQGFTNVFGVHGRFQLFRAGPFSAGVFTEIGGGPGYDARSTFFWNIGAIASLSFRNLVTVTVRMWGKIYRDQFCRSDPADPAEGETEPHWCTQLDVDAANPDNPDTSAEREALVNDIVPSRWRARMNEGDKAHRRGFAGARFMMSLTLEVAVSKNLSVHGELRGAPGMDQRAMWHDFFNTPMLSTVNGGDPRIYGGAGVTFKF